MTIPGLSDTPPQAINDKTTPLADLIRDAADHYLRGLALRTALENVGIDNGTLYEDTIEHMRDDAQSIADTVANHFFPAAYERALCGVGLVPR